MSFPILPSRYTPPSTPPGAQIETFPQRTPEIASPPLLPPNIKETWKRAREEEGFERDCKRARGQIHSPATSPYVLEQLNRLENVVEEALEAIRNTRAPQDSPHLKRMRRHSI